MVVRARMNPDLRKLDVLYVRRERGKIIRESREHMCTCAHAWNARSEQQRRQGVKEAEEESVAKSKTRVLAFLEAENTIFSSVLSYDRWKKACCRLYNAPGNVTVTWSSSIVWKSKRDANVRMKGERFLTSRVSWINMKQFRDNEASRVNVTLQSPQRSTRPIYNFFLSLFFLFFFFVFEWKCSNFSDGFWILTLSSSMRIWPTRKQICLRPRTLGVWLRSKTPGRGGNDPERRDWNATKTEREASLLACVQRESAGIRDVGPSVVSPSCSPRLTIATLNLVHLELRRQWLSTASAFVSAVGQRRALPPRRRSSLFHCRAPPTTPVGNRD